MRYQVPQFVDVEDKIIGPFTLKQFIIYMTAGMLLVPIYLVTDLSLFIALALPLIGIAAAFAHVKINGKSLFITIVNALNFFTKNQVYVWRRTSTPQIFTIKDPQWEELLIGREIARQELSSLTSIAQYLDTDGNISKTDEPDPLEETLSS